MKLYTYTVLRYIHDISIGEFLNVGVALYSPDQKYLGFLCRDTYDRIKNAYPGFDEVSFNKILTHIEASFYKLDDLIQEEPIKSSVLDQVYRVLPHDDSSLQWSPPGSGITNNLDNELTHIFNMMVMKYG